MKKLMSTWPGLNLVESILAIRQHWQILMSTCHVLKLDIKWKLVLANQSRDFIAVI